MDNLEEKYTRLKDILVSLDSVVVAFSGGVDSTFLAKVAKDTLGEKVAAITATSPTYPDFEFKEAKKLAEDIGIKHFIIESNELEIEGFKNNPVNRCYFCKSALFDLCRRKAQELGYDYILDGSNFDDKTDWRPGMDAAKQKGVRSPLLEAGLTKSDIRSLSKELGLSTWDKPSFACLSSRFPYGTEINYERLNQVARCENLLRDLAFKQFRVRYYEVPTKKTDGISEINIKIARIEIASEEIKRFLDNDIKEKVVSKCKEYGFDYVTLDLEGYRTGSMNILL